MDLRTLETFRAVVEAGGVARAAVGLHRAQSSITVRIRQLESSLGVALFERDGRALRLTTAGEVLYEYGGRLLDLASEARAAVRSDCVCGRIRLGAMESVAASRLPTPLAAFHRDYPSAMVELQTAPSRELVARVQAGVLDAAIVGETVDNARFISTPLYLEELVLVAAADCDRLDDPGRINGRTLLAFHGSGCAYRRRFDEWLHALRVVPARTLEFASYHALLAAAAAGVGVSLVPRSVLAVYPQREALTIAAVPARIGRLRTVLIAARSSHAPALASLIRLLRNDARATAEPPSRAASARRPGRSS